MAKFTPGKDVTYPMTYFIGSQAIRLGPGDEYETDDPAVIAEMEAHGGLQQVGGKKSEPTPEPDVEEADVEEADEGEGEVDYGSRPKTVLEDEARERGVYDGIEGSGSGGTVTKQDIVDALEADDAA